MSRTPKPRPLYWLAGLAFALVALSLAAVGLLAVRIDRVGMPAFVFLRWNLFLAWTPFVLSLCVAAVHGRGGPRPLLWVLEVLGKCDERAYARPQREGILDQRAAMGDETSLGLPLVGCRWRRAG